MNEASRMSMIESITGKSFGILPLRSVFKKCSKMYVKNAFPVYNTKILQYQVY